MEVISNKVLCRDAQLTELINLLGGDDEPLPYSLFISGNTATGKSLCVESVLRYFGYKHVFVNCVECYSVKIIFEMILEGLTRDFSNEICNKKCDKLDELIQNLNLLETMFKHCEPIVLVFDKVERLQKLDPTLIRTFLRLREFCNMNICTIFITDLIYDNFNFRTGLREPIKIYFQNYTKDELFKIIFLNQNVFVRHILNNQMVDAEVQAELSKPELFGNFLNAFLSVFYRPCRDLNELRHMALVNFAKYCEPIVNGDIKGQDLQKLWRHIAPILKTSLELLYLRINTNPTAISQSPGKENNIFSKSEINLEKNLKDELISTKMFAQSFELPYYTKYLLIAAYLASYNPPKEDKRLFMKNHGKQRKRLQQVKAKAKINEKLNTQLGPKIFPLDRLLAIFYAILEEKISLTSNLLSQIATLVDLKLISGSKEIDLDSAKYKCMVGYDFISAIAQTVGFNIRKYLYDFL